MDRITLDEAYTPWTTPELITLYRVRMRRLLTLDVARAPRTLLVRQERLVAQARRLCRKRGVENPSMR